MPPLELKRMTRCLRNLVVLTGAGLSADSGLATFRGGGGLWEGHRVEDVATPEAWVRNRALVWSFYQMRRRALTTVEPNEAHVALARLECELAARGEGFLLVTQNVDDLHVRAGSKPLCMHGRLIELRCERCGAVTEDLVSLDPALFVACTCGHEALRPGVVWFGERPLQLERIERALNRCTDFWALGTSGVVYPAAGMLAAARGNGARTLVSALDEPENLEPGDRFVPGSAAQVVPRLVDAFLAG